MLQDSIVSGFKKMKIINKKLGKKRRRRDIRMEAARELKNTCYDDGNSSEETRSDDDEEGENQENVEVPKSSQIDTELGFVEGIPHNGHFEDESKFPDGLGEPKESGDLDHGDHCDEEIRKRKGKGIYNSDPDDDESKHDKPPELLDGFDASIPIAPRMMEKMAHVPTSSHDNPFYTEEEFERPTHRAKRQSLIGSEYSRSSSHRGSGSSSPAMEGPSSSDNPPVEQCPPQRKREMPVIHSGPSSFSDPPVESFSTKRKRIMPWIPCAVCCVAKPPEHMARVYCTCWQYDICLDYCIINLGVEEARLNTRLVCPDCFENLFHMDLWELIAYVLCKLLEMDSLFRN